MFRFTVGSAPVDLRLTDVAAGPKARPKSESFSVLFEGVAAFPQGTRTVTHPSLGQFLLFVVPVGRPQTARTYQAVFNRL